GRLTLEKTADATRLTANPINVTVKDFLIDSLAHLDTSRFYGSQAIDVEVSNIAYTRSDGLYRLSAKALHAATDNGELIIDSLRYHPLVTMAAFYRQKKVAEDMVNMNIPRIRLLGIDLQEWTGRQAIIASTIHIDSSGTIDVSKDLQYPEPIENKIGR